jgi:membrane-associated protease RseP (regulator of RpoE activity)
MVDTKKEPEPMTAGEINFLAFFLAVVLGLFVAEIIHDYKPVKLTALFIVLWWMPLLVVHEAGHALMAAALGWHVGRVVIGFGRLVHKFRVGGTAVEVRMIPLEGFIVPIPRDLRVPRLKSALIYFAGCGAQLVILAVVVAVVGLETMVSASDQVPVLAAQSLGVVVLLRCVFNLLPLWVSDNNSPDPDKRIASDGLTIIRSFTRPEDDFAALVGLTYNDEAGEWVRAGPADPGQRGDP